MVKFSGAALGGLAFGGAMLGPGAGKARAEESCPAEPCYPVDIAETRQYSYFRSLPEFIPIRDRQLDENEMRITFLGSNFPPTSRRRQQEMSVFVEVGWDKANDRPLDQFVFDCGCGVTTNYMAMKIGFGRMDKIFLNHLHGDHMSDVGHIYCFGPSTDRVSPLYVWGPSLSGLIYTDPNGKVYGPYEDGTKAYCETLRAAMRWHSESFSFLGTSYASYKPPTRKSWGLPVDPIPVGEDAPNDAYALVPIELDWTKRGDTPGDNIAYHNKETGVKITHFPVIHCRMGSIGYKLEWRGLSMIYTSDTRPETNCIDQAINGRKGVDVFIHEMIIPPEVQVMKNAHLPQPLAYPGPDWWKNGVDKISTVQASSHTPQGAFGFILSQIIPRPRLTVATHFPVADDTVACALNSVRAHVPDIAWSKDYDPVNKNITWSDDLMVIRVTKRDITQLRGVVENYGWIATPHTPDDLNTPKYWMWKTDEDGNLILDENGNPIPVGNPKAQILTTTEIPATNPDGSVNYCENGY